jgi:hypothetical protein
VIAATEDRYGGGAGGAVDGGTVVDVVVDVVVVVDDVVLDVETRRVASRAPFPSQPATASTRRAVTTAPVGRAAIRRS